MESVTALQVVLMTEKCESRDELHDLPFAWSDAKIIRNMYCKSHMMIAAVVKSLCGHSLGWLLV